MGETSRPIKYNQSCVYKDCILIWDDHDAPNPFLWERNRSYLKLLVTFGSVRRSFNMPSSNDEPSSFFFFFMNSPRTDLDWPKLVIENEPTLFILMTSGMDGKIKTASRRSRWGDTTSTTCEYEDRWARLWWRCEQKRWKNFSKKLCFVPCRPVLERR